MHEWHTQKSTNPEDLIRHFSEFSYQSDWYDGETKYVNGVHWSGREFKNDADGINYCSSASYGDTRASGCIIVPNKKSKGFINALERYNVRRREFEEFDNELNIGYGRTSEKVTCPCCKSMINRAIAQRRRFRNCPICGSEEIISKSNWDKLKLKKKLLAEAAENLSKEAIKCDIHWLASFEWHS